MAWPKLYNVVKYRNELSSAGKIYLNNKLVSSAVIQSENANESTQIYNKKIYFLNAQSSPTQVCYFFSTQPFTDYFTLQCGGVDFFGRMAPLAHPLTPSL